MRTSVHQTTTPHAGEISCYMLQEDHSFSACTDKQSTGFSMPIPQLTPLLTHEQNNQETGEAGGGGGGALTMSRVLTITVLVISTEIIPGYSRSHTWWVNPQKAAMTSYAVYCKGLSPQTMSVWVNECHEKGKNSEEQLNCEGCVSQRMYSNCVLSRLGCGSVGRVLAWHV